MSFPEKKEQKRAWKYESTWLKFAQTEGIFSLTRLKDIGLIQSMNMVNGFYKRDKYSSYVTIMLENKRSTFYHSGNAEFSLV